MPDLSQWNILIVDDEPDNIGVLELVFRHHKAKVRTAESCEDGLVMMEEELPTVVLTDIRLPGMSGYEFLQHIREKWQYLPVIAITAHAMDGDAVHIMEHGFTGYFAKPINTMTIADEVKALLDAKNR